MKGRDTGCPFYRRQKHSACSEHGSTSWPATSLPALSLSNCRMERSRGVKVATCPTKPRRSRKPPLVKGPKVPAWPALSSIEGCLKNAALTVQRCTGLEWLFTLSSPLKGTLAVFVDGRTSAKALRYSLTSLRTLFGLRRKI